MPNKNLAPYQNGSIKLTNGRMTKLGTLGAVNDFVQFTIPSPSSPHRGYVNLQISAATGWTVAGITFTLQVSMDEARSFASWPTQTGGGTGGGDFGGLPQALFFASYIVSGMGSGIFQFGIQSVGAGVIGNPADVWGLCG